MSSNALCMAAKAGFAERVDALIDASANVNGVDKRGYSALMCAVENASAVETAWILTDAGANVNFVAVC
jgi:ankyrin repeat protein